MSTLTPTDARGLRAHCLGGVVTPGESGWDDARRAFNLAVDQRPAAVAFPADEDDVASVVRFAREHGLRAAPQATGHCAGPLGDLAGTVLVKTSAMTGVEIDAEAGRARVQAGARWEHVTPRASALGLAALHGSSPTVGVVGYSLGGGLGWYARRHGLQANSVSAVELVTADGRHVRADAHHEPELFWALRGGGGSFGIVTALEFALHPVQELCAGALFFDLDRAGEVLPAWHELTGTLPEETTSVGRVLRLPPLPDLPLHLRGRSFAVIELAHLGPEEEVAELVRPLRVLGPELDTLAPVAPVALGDLHMDPPAPVPALTGSRLLGDLPAAAVEALVEVAGPGSGCPLLSVELRHLGGALGRGGADHGALDRLRGEYALFAVGVPMPFEAAPAVQDGLEAVTGRLERWVAGRYLNFAEQETDLAEAFTPATLARLRRVKAHYDPEDLLRANHPIPPAA